MLVGGSMSPKSFVNVEFSELYFRHMYMLANGPGHQDRVESFHNYCEMFNYIINPEDKVFYNFMKLYL